MPFFAFHAVRRAPSTTIYHVGAPQARRARFGSLLQGHHARQMYSQNHVRPVRNSGDCTTYTPRYERTGRCFVPYCVKIDILLRPRLILSIYYVIKDPVSLLCRPSTAAASQSLVPKLMAQAPKVCMLLSLRVSDILSALHHRSIGAPENDALDPEVNAQLSRVYVATLVNPITIVSLDIVKCTYPPLTTIRYPNSTTITTSDLTKHQNDDTVIPRDCLPDPIDIRRQYFSVALHSLPKDFNDVSNRVQTL